MNWNQVSTTQQIVNRNYIDVKCSFICMGGRGGQVFVMTKTVSNGDICFIMVRTLALFTYFHV